LSKSETINLHFNTLQFAYFKPHIENNRKSFKYQPQITTIKTNVLKNLLNATHTHTHTQIHHKNTQILALPKQTQ